MKLIQLIIGLSISLFTTHSMCQSLGSNPTQKVMKLTKRSKSVCIPTTSKVIIRTDTHKYYGALDSIADKQLFVNGLAIQTEDIKTIKFKSSERKNKGISLLLSAPVMLFAGVGSLVLAFACKSDPARAFAITALSCFLYSPIAHTTGLVLLSKKKKFKLKRGWEISIVKSNKSLE